MGSLSVRQRFGRWLLKAATGGSIVLVPPWNRRAFMRPTYQQLALEGYQGSGAVFACISALAFGFPKPPLLVWEETEAGRVPLPEHNLSQLLARPNDQMGLRELLQFTVIYMAIGGKAYWYKVRSSAKRVVELLPVHAGQLTPVAGETALVDHYELETGAGQKQSIAETDVVAFSWLPHALSPQMGLAPLVAVAREVDTDNEATRYLFSLLKNDAMPRLALVLPKDAQPLTDESFDRMKEQWTEEHGGEKRGGIALLEGGLDVKQLASNLKELEFNVLRRVPEARICAAFRVPPVIAGLNVGLEQMTYDNVKGMRLEFTEGILSSLWEMLADKVTQDLLPEFGEQGKKIVAFDTSKVPVLAEKTEARRQSALTAMQAGAITVNEYRAAASLPRDENGDVYLRSIATIESPGQFTAPKGKAPPGKAEGPSPSGGDEPGPMPGPSGPAGAVTKMAHKRASPADMRRLAKVVAAQRAVREKLTPKMAKELDKWFGDQADRAIARAKAAKGPKGTKQDLPNPEDLITAGDGKELAKLLGGFYLEIIRQTWPLWNDELSSDLVFDAADPAVARVLAMAGDRVKDINETTIENLRVLLEQGHEQGWSIDRIVRGDPENGIPGLRDIIEESYKNRSETIARTELGTAQNLASAERYDEAGVSQVIVFDNGAGDEDQPCIDANGQVWTLEEMQANPLEHPNCTRSFGAFFSEESARPATYGAKDMPDRRVDGLIRKVDELTEVLSTRPMPAAQGPLFEIKADNMTIEQRPEIKNEITVPAPDMRPVAEAVERAMERVGKAIEDAPAPPPGPAPVVQVDVHVPQGPEPKVEIVNEVEVKLPSRITGKKTIRRGRDGLMTSVEEETELEP